MTKIFICYRHDDSKNSTEKLFYRMRSDFGIKNVFSDIEIPLGCKFEEVIAEKIRWCDVFIVVIGMNWVDLLTQKDTKDELDYVRLEIELALKLKKFIIPVRLSDAPILNKKALPESINYLADLLSHEISDNHFDIESSRLTRDIQTLTKPSLASKREFLLSACTGIVAGSASGWGAAWGQSEYHHVAWKMWDSFHVLPGHPILKKAPYLLKQRLEQASSSRFTLDIEKPSDGKDMLDTIKNGDIQCATFFPYYLADSKYYPTYFGCGVPFGLSPLEQLAWLQYKESNEADEITYIQIVFRDILEGLARPFPIVATGPQMGGVFQIPMNEPKDFNEKKFRIPGLGFHVLSQEPFKINGNQLYASMTGNQIFIRLNGPDPLHGAEWIGPYDDCSVLFHQDCSNGTGAAKILDYIYTKKLYYYYPGWWEPGTSFFVLVNEKEWTKLPPELKQIFRSACLDVYIDTLNEYINMDSDLFNHLKQLDDEYKNDLDRTYAKLNISLRSQEDREEDEIGRLRRFNSSIIDAGYIATQNLLHKYSGDDPVQFGAIFKTWSAFKHRMRDWSGSMSIGTEG